MRIEELQNDIKTILASDEHLAAACSIVCSDALDVVNAIEQALAKSSGLLVLVNAPEIERDGCAKCGIPCRASVTVDAIEMPAMRHLRDKANAIRTAMDAALRVAFLLDGPRYNFVSVRPMVDEKDATLTARATFNTSWTIKEL